MADDDIRRSSLDEIKQMRANGLTKATPADAPELQLDEAFWHTGRRQGTPHPHGQGAQGLRAKPWSAHQQDEGMTDDDMELIRGSGNVFRDLGYPDAEVRQAEARTGIAYAEFSRIRNVKLERFTFDRLLAILDKLG